MLKEQVKKITTGVLLDLFLTTMVFEEFIHSIYEINSFSWLVEAL